jgi:flagellar L-ring protein precursor FlgH
VKSAVSLVILFAVLVTAVAGVLAKPIYNQNSPMVNLFSDHKASKVGDLVYIIIDESTTINRVRDERTSKDAGLNFATATGFLQFLGKIGGADAINTNNESNHDTSTDKISSSVTATVTAVNANNNVLTLECKRNMVVNQVKYQVLLRGKVRADDITPQNTVRSTQVADMQLTLAKQEKRGIFKVIMDFFFK